MTTTALAIPFRQFCRDAGISVPTGYNEINAGRLKAVKRGTRTLIKAEDAKAWLDALPSVSPKKAA